MSNIDLNSIHVKVTLDGETWYSTVQKLIDTAWNIENWQTDLILYGRTTMVYSSTGSRFITVTGISL